MAAGRTDRIFLLGISGAGKSTAGAALAALLGWRFVDTDREIERHAGRSIPDIFGPGNAGEPGFRRMEARLLAELAGEHEVVVATGGGAVTNPDSRNAMASGFRAWLQVEASEAARRLVESPGSEGRPLLRADDSDPELAGRSPREVATVRLQRMLAARSPWYAEADTTLAVDGRSPREIALACLATLRGVAAVVDAPGSRYDILVENGALDQLGRICRERKLRGRAFIVTDEKMKITQKAGVDGKLFGSVTNHDIVDALKAQGFEVERSHIRMPTGALKQVGEYPLQIALHTDVVVTITVSVIGEA